MNIDTLSLMVAVFGAVVTLVASYLGLQTKQSRWGLVIAAGILTVIATSVVWAVLRFWPPSETGLTAHVVDAKGASVSGARVLLFGEGGPLREITDSDGIANFVLESLGSGAARLFVQTDGFEIHDESINLSGSQTINVKLVPRSGDDQRVIVRVVDNISSNPIQGATVVLIVAGKGFEQSTDANGLTKFTISFVGDMVEADLSVSAPGYNIKPQKVTLRSEEVQDARLNAAAQALTITSVDVTVVATPPANGSNTLTFGQTVSGEIMSPADTDRHTFAANTGNVVIIKVGKVEGDFWPQIRVFDPMGQAVGQRVNGAISAELNVTLPVDGVYTILVDDGRNGTSTGKYNLHIEKIN